MKRFLLGLVMASSLALAAAPMANAAGPGFCGTAAANSSYAFEVDGTEPSVGAAIGAWIPLNYIAGVGVLQFGAGSATGCTITGGEMVYYDNDLEGVLAGSTGCDGAASLPIPGGNNFVGDALHGPYPAAPLVPCFDGNSHITGAVSPGPNGGWTLSFTDTFGLAEINPLEFPWWAPFTTPIDSSFPLTFTFTVFNTTGNSTVIGNSNVPGTGAAFPPGPGDPCCGTDDNGNAVGPSETAWYAAVLTPGQTLNGAGYSTPPYSAPVLSFTAQKQAPVSKFPLNAIPTAYGAAPYIGQSAFYCKGFGGGSGDLFDYIAAGGAGLNNAPTGAFSASSGSVTTFASPGAAFGSTTTNANDEVGNTSGFGGYDCDLEQTLISAYGNGTSNNRDDIYDEDFPFPSPCYDADLSLLATPPLPIGAASLNSSVVWGTSDQNAYSLKLGNIVYNIPADKLAAANLLLAPAGITIGSPLISQPGASSLCTSIQESAVPGKLTALVTPITQTDSGPYPQTKSSPIKLTNTSEAECTVAASLTPVTGPQSLCSVTLSAPVGISEGDTVNTSWTADCTCTSKAKTTVETDTYTLGLATVPVLTPNPSASPPIAGLPATCPFTFTSVTLTCKN